jgi:hypothetical protein
MSAAITASATAAPAIIAQPMALAVDGSPQDAAPSSTPVGKFIPQTLAEPQTGRTAQPRAPVSRKGRKPSAGGFRPTIPQVSGPAYSSEGSRVSGAEWCGEMERPRASPAFWPPPLDATLA